MVFNPYPDFCSNVYIEAEIRRNTDIKPVSLAAGCYGSGRHQPVPEAEKKSAVFFAVAGIAIVYFCTCQPFHMVEKQQLSKYCHGG